MGNCSKTLKKTNPHQFYPKIDNSDQLHRKTDSSDQGYRTLGQSDTSDAFPSTSSLPSPAPEPAKSTLPVVRLYGSLTSPATSYIRFALLYKPVTLIFVPSEKSDFGFETPVIQYGSDVLSGSSVTILRYLDAKFPKPVLLSCMDHQENIQSTPLISTWPEHDHWLFLIALATVPDDITGLWQNIAHRVPGRTAEEVKAYHDAWEIHLMKIIGGPHHCLDSELRTSQNELETGKGKCERVVKERKKGSAWSVEEHRRFLKGLEIYGKGDWRSISRIMVVTRTATQVASHAQKYYQRQNADRAERKGKKRRSIHDITTTDATNVVHAQPTPPATDFYSHQRPPTPQSPRFYNDQAQLLPTPVPLNVYADEGGSPTLAPYSLYCEQSGEPTAIIGDEIQEDFTFYPY